jgi:hypothetical protein
LEPIVEVHNEPNLVEEGLTLSWSDGWGFGIWLTDVLSLYRGISGFQGVQFIYPGLSPGETIQGVREDSTTFLEGSIASGVLVQVDGVAVHAYWSTGWSMQTAIDHVNYTQLTTLKPIYATEVSRNDRPAIFTPEVYGIEYALFRNSVDIDGVYYFVGSASNSYFWPECWVENGVTKGIATAMVNAL